MDELRTGLDLATHAELAALAEVLFRPKFNPLDYWYTPSPHQIVSGERHRCIQQLDARIRYLAADGFTVLRHCSHQLSYRQILIRLAQQLRLNSLASLPTLELEAELFLQLLERTWYKLSPQQQQELQQRLTTEIAQTEAFKQLSPQLQRHPMALLLKGSGAVAISSMLRPWLLGHIAKQMAWHMARYQAARTALQATAHLGAQLQSRAVMGLASRNVALTAARYGAVRGALACLGPAMWTWFVVDLGWRTIAANYTRIVPVVFTLAQLRLTRGDRVEPSPAMGSAA